MQENKINTFLDRFRNNDRGAVTVDWVVITAGVLALLLSIMALVGSEAETLATETGTFIRERGE